MNGRLRRRGRPFASRSRTSALKHWPAALGALALLVVMGCDPSDDAIAARIVESVGESTDSIDLGAVVEGEWDRLCIAGPYTSDEHLDELLGRWSWRLASRTGIHMLDSHALLVFLDGKDIMASAMVPLRPADFTPRDGNYCLSRDEAVFTAEDDGWTLKMAPR